MYQSVGADASTLAHSTLLIQRIADLWHRSARRARCELFHRREDPVRPVVTILPTRERRQDEWWLKSARFLEKIKS
jgi:hypothetical protein